MSILSGIRIIEIEGIGPAPFCGMHLADMGADVVVVERPSTGEPPVGDIGHNTIYKRNKRIVQLDLKDSGDRAKLLEMVKHADGLIEGMRPGVMERLELGQASAMKLTLLLRMVASLVGGKLVRYLKRQDTTLTI